MMKIKTSYCMTPLPIRNYDWSAIDDETYDGEGCLIGYGATEQEAIENLLEEIEYVDCWI